MAENPNGSDFDITVPDSYWHGTRQRTGQSTFGPVAAFVGNPQILVHARSVAYIRRSDGGGGSGFLVAPDLLLTNNHVLPNPAEAAACTVWFNFNEADSNGNPIVGVADPFTCTPSGPDGLFVTSPMPNYTKGERVDNKHLDFTLVRINQPMLPGTRWSYIPITGYRPDTRPGMGLAIIQHPQHLPTQVGVGPDQLKWRNDWVIQYVTDTEYGSSGSPVFNLSIDNTPTAIPAWQLVGVHHLRVALHDSGLKGNEAIFITAILKELSVAAPQLNLPGPPNPDTTP